MDISAEELLDTEDNFVSVGVQRKDLRHINLRIQSAISVENNNIEYSEVLIDSYKGIYGAGNVIDYVRKNNIEEEFDLEIFEKLAQHITMNPKYRNYKAIGFNFCAKTISRIDIVSKIKDILRLYDINTNKLVIEINESSDFEKDGDIIKENIRRLQKLGFKVALDDFGTERATVKVLMDYNFDIVKIDRSLIGSDIEEEESTSRVLLQCIAKVIRMKQQKSIIEGVETKEQLRVIKSLGYDSVQGFVFGKPKAMN